VTGAHQAPARWVAPNFKDLLHETWEAETFLFNPLSGHTHVLNQEAMALLETLSQEPSSTRALIERFAAGNEHPQAPQALVQQLMQLELLGLICRVQQQH